METVLCENGDIRILCDNESGGIVQFALYGQSLLGRGDPATAEVALNGLPLRTRSSRAETRRMLGSAGEKLADEDLPSAKHQTLYAERFINQYTGFGLAITRHLRPDPHLRRVSLSYYMRRQKTPPTCPCPGPGGPPIEARLYVDALAVPRWPWRFWGEETRMLHLSLHSTGPDGPEGHIGYNRGPVAEVKSSLGNIWRRQYPGVMAIHGAVYYNKAQGHWLALTCRRPQVGYVLDLEGCGEGLSYSFLLHHEFALHQTLQLPEIVFHYGPDRDSMEQFVRDYTTKHWLPMPEWNSRATWFGFNLWSAHTSWPEVWAKAHRLVDAEVTNAIGPYNMFHHWSRSLGGTAPLGYEPDPAMGRRDEFEKGALSLKERGIPLGIWMSHSGLAPGAEIDPDWFIYGIDNDTTASWGSEHAPSLVCINPGHPGYIAYTKKWIKYYIELGFRWFFFDCGGWALPPDYRPRSFMRFPADTGLMAVRFYEEITPYALSLDPGVVISGEGFSSDFPVHLTSLHSNPVHSPDGLGPRDYVLSWNRRPGPFVCVDQAGSLVPASGRCSLGEELVPPGLSFSQRFEWIAQNEMFKAVKAFVERHGIYQGHHLPGDYSVVDKHLFFPGRYKGEELFLPEEYEACSCLRHAVTGHPIQRQANGAFVAPEPGLYEMNL